MAAGDDGVRDGWMAEITTRGRTRLVTATGSVELRPRERAVLAAIAASHPRPAETDDLIVRTWGDDAPLHARKSLHNHIGRIRRTAPHVIETTGEGYTINPEVRVDHVGGDPEDTPLGDLFDGDEVEQIRAGIDEQRHVELERRLRSETEPTLDSVATAQRLVDAEPDRENLWALLATIQARLGKRRNALATIRSARRALGEYGLEIGAELVELEALLLRGAEAVERPARRGPPRVHPHRDDPFVGRDAELADLQAAWERVVESRSPQLVIVRGPAGIGKTRLVDQFVRSVVDGAEGDPNVIVARERVDDDRPLGSLTDVLARSLSVPGDPADADVVDLQHRVDDAVGLIAAQPTVWSIDDLQWMPTDSLRLLTHALEIATGPMLVVTTHRPGELESPGLLDRRVATTVVELDPLALTELEDLVGAWSIPTDHHGDLDLLHRRTAGLPLFASEVARVARRRNERIDASGVPGALRDWVRSRLEELDDDATEVVQTAAAIGAEFQVDVLAASVDLDDDRFDAAVDGLAVRGVVAPASDADRFQFAHAIVRDVVYEMLGPARARRRHARIAAVIAEHPDTDRPATWNASMALHLSRAGASGPTVRAHAVAACDEQLRNGAWTAAGQSIALALGTRPGDAERAELLARRGRALLQLQEFDEAAASLTDAIDISRRLGLSAIQGRAALDLVGRAGRGAAVEASDEERIAVVRDALDALGPDTDDGVDQTVLRSELERELAFALLLTPHVEERNGLLTAAVERVEALDDPPTAALAAVLLGRRYAFLAPDLIDRRLADIDRVLALDRRAVRADTVITAHLYRVEEQLRAGNTDEAHRSLRDADAALVGYPEPYSTWAAAGWRVVLTLRDGDVRLAETLAVHAAATGGHSEGAMAGLGVHLTNIRLLQDRSGEMVGPLRQAVDDHPEIPAYRAVLALCAAESGDRDLAHESIAWFSSSGFGNLPNDTSRSLALATLAHATAEIGDAEVAAGLAPLVTPYAGQHFVISTYGGGGAYWGPASHAIGRLAATVGDDAAARRWFDDARRDASDAPLFLARIDADLDALR